MGLRNPKPDEKEIGGGNCGHSVTLRFEHWKSISLASLIQQWSVYEMYGPLFYADICLEYNNSTWGARMYSS